MTSETLRSPETGFRPLVILNAVGLTQRLLIHAPNLAGLAEKGFVKGLHESLPAVTCTAQATMLTGKTPQEHGIVGNGWYFGDTGEVRFWQQSRDLIQAPTFYDVLKERFQRQGRQFRAAKLFWWFNQGADVAYSVTPKPYYGSDGNKAFGILGSPDGLTENLEAVLGPFPFPSFWGPKAGLPATTWISLAAARVLEEQQPDLTLVYLPHLDYEPQRTGPSGCDMKKLTSELDAAARPIIDSAARIGADVWVVSEYGHCDVRRPVEINRAIRKAGWLHAREGPFGEVFDPLGSQAFAVVDHQLAHVTVREKSLIPKVAEMVAALPGVAKVYVGSERDEIGLDHPRAGNIVALADPDAHFVYPFWLDDAKAPDYARTVDIHRKPGYDACELFFDPALRFPMLKMVRKLIRKKMGFRTLFDVIPLDSSLVRGSHGLAASEPLDRPVFIGSGAPPFAADDGPMTAVFSAVLRHFGESPG
jgi:predicted AlkP superfamily pyrophosphatase or phosphodiesterase